MEANVANEEYLDTSETEANAQSSEDSEPAADVEVSIEGLQAQLASLAAAFESAKEQSLRSQAEAQNARRRAEQDVEKAHKFGLEKMVNDLLPVVDNLERALAAIDQTNETLAPIMEGIQLTHKSFVDALARHQVGRGKWRSPVAVVRRSPSADRSRSYAGSPQPASRS
jgi:molecular chaperone GrpE